MSRLTELLAKVEAATGPGRELDAAIFQAIDPECPAGAVHMADPSHDPGDLTMGHYGAYTFTSAPEFTASIDAALALVERALGKEWCWQVKSAIQHQCILWTLETDWDDRTPPTGYATTAPVAILAALLKALISPAIQPPSKTGERR
jgi:hypothetical protein